MNLEARPWMPAIVLVTIVVNDWVGSEGIYIPHAVIVNETETPVNGIPVLDADNDKARLIRRGGLTVNFAGGYGATDASSASWDDTTARISSTDSTEPIFWGSPAPYSLMPDVAVDGREEPPFKPLAHLIVTVDHPQAARWRQA
jgi:hypothetical protein